MTEMPSVTQAVPMPDSLLRDLSRIGHRMRFQAGRMLIEAGAASQTVYLILEGQLRATMFSANGREVIFRDLFTGTMFGELAALDSGVRAASVIAMTDCRLLAVSGDAFKDVVHTSAENASWLTSELVRQIRGLTDKVFELSALNVRGRLYCELLRLAASGERDGSRTIVRPAPIHSELAARIGANREAVSREIEYLSHHKIASLRHRTLLIEDSRLLSDALVAAR